jgi:DNA-binding MarR family transcriptional regulator
MALMTFLLRGSGQAFYALVAELDLSITQIKTLHVLEQREGELSVKELAELLGLSVPAASRTVEGLWQRGYLERREDEHDRRVKRVQMTASGREIAARLHRERLAGLQELVATLSERQRTQLSAALASLIERDEIAACHPKRRTGPRP